MGLETLLQSRDLNSQLCATESAIGYRQPTPEEVERKRKEHEEYERKRIVRELTTMKLTTTITLFREFIAQNITSDNLSAWNRAEASTEFLFSQFEGLTAETIDPYRIIQALGQTR